MIQAIAVHEAFYQGHLLDYYAEVCEGMSCLIWEAMRARQNMELCDPIARSLVGWNGFLPMSSGT